MANERASGKLYTKGAFLGDIKICNRLENVRQIRKPLIGEKSRNLSAERLSMIDLKVKWDTASSLKYLMELHQSPPLLPSPPDFDLSGFILVARALANPTLPLHVRGLTLLSGLIPWLSGCPRSLSPQPAGAKQRKLLDLELRPV